MKKLMYLGIMSVVCVLIACGGGTTDDATEEQPAVVGDTTAVESTVVDSTEAPATDGTDIAEQEAEK